MSKIKSLVRPHILALQPYSSARDEYSGTEGVFLDANENPLGSAGASNFNRYPDPYQHKLKEKLALIKNVKPAQIFLGNGSDEAIDLLFRVFCNPNQDNIITMPPTYGMYEVSANINCVAIKKINLTPDFQIDTEKVLAAADQNTKLLFVCSPNNPSGNLLNRNSIEKLLQNFKGIVVIDEAYIDFSGEESWTNSLEKYPNLIVLQTFSKAWGLAALRLGMAFSNPEIIALINKVKPPYNISQLTQQIVLQSLFSEDAKNEMVAEIIKQKKILTEELGKISVVKKVYPSDANYLLIKTENGKKVYDFLVEKQIIVRDRSKVALCEGCLRISVGTAQENKELIAALQLYHS
ncbi:MAG: histidinol-phosphate transaminase [Bacteroidetes bacterium]|nr:MAG: histidinol-phosphate transaminase [Bacteroidota bacterium]